MSWRLIPVGHFVCEYCFFGESIDMVQMNLFTKQKLNQRYKQQTYGF